MLSSRGFCSHHRQHEKHPLELCSAQTKDGNGTLLQYSCLENPMDGGAWWAAVYGVAQSRTRLKQLTLNHVLLFATPWSAAYQAPLSMGFSQKARAASRPGLCAIAPGRRAGAPPLWQLARCPGYYKQCCDEHWGTRVSFPSDFLSVYAQQWDCWIIRQVYFQFF